MGKLGVIALAIILLVGALIIVGPFGSVLFLNKGYARNIEMETYVMTEEMLAEALANHWEQKIQQEKHRELFGKQVYMVIRVKNAGNLAAWGFLTCNVNYRNNERVYIDGVSFGRWFNYMIPMGEFTSNNDSAVPVIRTKWEQLYAK